ncbi:hypothetical protein RchiOBHm_Chr5g0032511 [Rosa chinensis]|uniref:Uncharacterized protein n=1 Tax=Rosa chinensis TaxID=74649 RepID=A0A2P6QAG5_ROSCH|nr:hypothetical protein RchiOBHm_Chr5g0032511 [Rosa chinensis]
MWRGRRLRLSRNSSPSEVGNWFPLKITGGGTKVHFDARRGVSRGEDPWLLAEPQFA